MRIEPTNAPDHRKTPAYAAAGLEVGAKHGFAELLGLESEVLGFIGEIRVGRYHAWETHARNGSKMAEPDSKNRLRASWGDSSWDATQLAVEGLRDGRRAEQKGEF
ncbi:MAG: hypothetical protein MK135_08730 [Polyangiaceae bacterium]|nr:hypothetical protein [Polyangiaceae bacterium]